MAPGLYHIDPPMQCNTCYQDNPQIRLQKVGNSLCADTAWRFQDGPVDVESDLRGIGRTLTRDDEGPQIPIDTPNLDLPTCTFTVDNTRLTNPACNLRGVPAVDRFMDYNVTDPVFPIDFMEHTRNQARDNFRMKLEQPRVNCMHPKPNHC